eukprot:Nitzschia sp. Nitz4//scaffold170_size48074//7445//9766//NITZ4_007101-RA/size48074-processed-gene-0.18-mRNA-1//-1//CDS//3329538628//9416//frame0
MTTQEPIQSLVGFLDNPEKALIPLINLPTASDVKNEPLDTQSQLIQAAQTLFSDIEKTAQMYQQLSQRRKGKKKEEDESQMFTLSGLTDMFIPETSRESPLDAETLWGQVELQNNALNKLLKKSIKRLAKSPKDIVLLDMGDDSDDEDGVESDQDGADDNDASEQEGFDMEEDEDDEDEDDEARRIRERMERTMAEMDSDAEDDDDDEEEEGDDENESELSSGKAKQEPKEELYDPMAEDMKDGFFDLNEMEDFADEEEDYLPEEAFGEPENNNNKKPKKENKSFHQMQRDGDMLNQSDDDDDEMDEEFEEDMGTVKRKKYREAEDIDALYNLYQAPNEDDSDEDDDDDDVVNMTAADFFGQPSKKHMARYNEKKAKEEIKDDDDSWGEYDFTKDEGGWGTNEGAEDGESDDDEADDDEDEEDDGEEVEEMNDVVENSKHGRQQDRLKKQTAELEKELLAEKPWKMTGETNATSRPVNSLLEGTPEFEMASKQAPTITIEHTENLEEIIKARILAEDWDDVVPRELPDVGWNQRRGELPEVSQEKSKLGLGELYEREYLKKALGYDKDAAEKETEEDKAKDEMKRLFANLCSKLDALSNYHFAPRPVAEEAEVRTSTAPAIAMEEVLPLHVSDARGVAPQEVYGTKRGRDGVLRGDTEMDQQERKRLRQSKKASRRKARKEKLADDKLVSRLQPGLGLNNPYEKRKMREELAAARSKGKVTTGEQDLEGKYGSSGTFFKRLQAEAQQTIHGKSSGGTTTEEKRPKSKSSALKL